MSKNILVVIENEDLRTSILRLLTVDPKNCIEAVGVRDREEAIRALEAEPKRFDMVVTESGENSSFWFFASTIRQIKANMQIVLYAEDKSAEVLRSYVHAIILKLEDDAPNVLKQKILRLLAS